MRTSPEERSKHRLAVLESARDWLTEIDEALEGDPMPTPREAAEPKENPGLNRQERRSRSLAMPKKVRDEVDRQSKQVETK